jgi:hypothetical protein
MIKRLLLILSFFTLINAAYTQTRFPSGDFWALDAGIGIGNIHGEDKGTSYQAVFDPKLWLSPPLMAGSRIGINYSSDYILTFEGQVYLRWNFLRLGRNENKKINLFAQGGLGLISAYRGEVDSKNPFTDVTRTRGSLMADGALGITVPITEKWHIEVSGRGGYPHIWGVSVITGIKIPLPQKIIYRSEYSDVLKSIPASEIVKRIMISSVEYVLFGPDIGRYNVGIDRDAQALNELTLNSIAATLKDNPELRVRIEGHANPATPDPEEADELMALSVMRANNIAYQLKAKGVREEQIVIIAFGGTRTITSDYEVRNRNRRVELMIIQVDTN